MAEYVAWMFIHDARIEKNSKLPTQYLKRPLKLSKELGLSEPEKRRLHQLAFIGKIKETSDGCYYIECKHWKHC